MRLCRAVNVEEHVGSGHENAATLSRRALLACRIFFDATSTLKAFDGGCETRNSCREPAVSSPGEERNDDMSVFSALKTPKLAPGTFDLDRRPFEGALLALLSEGTDGRSSSLGPRMAVNVRRRAIMASSLVAASSKAGEGGALGE